MAKLAGAVNLSIHSVPILIVSTIILFIGLFVLIQNRKSVSNTVFFLICLCVNLWLYGSAFLYPAPTPEAALRIYKSVTFLGVSFVATMVYLFSVVWLKLARSQKGYAALGLLGSLFFYLSGWTNQDSFPGMYHYFWGHYPHYGIVNVCFLVFFFGYFFAAFCNFAIAYRRESSLILKTQIKYIAVAFVISFMGSIDFLPKLVYWPVYPIGYFCVFIWIMTVAYAIVKYRVMDIETVIHKTLMWAVLSSLVFLPIAAGFFFFKELFIQMPPALSSVVGVAVFWGLMIYAKRIQPWIDHFFQRRKYDLERVLIKFNDNLVHLKGLSELVAYIMQTMRDVLYVDKVHVFLKSGNERRLVRVDAVKDGLSELSADEAFIVWLEEHDDVVRVDFIDIDPRFEQITKQARDFFENLGIKVCVPLVLNGELMGLILLGQKLNLKIFRAPEILFLSELRHAVTIAFSNSIRLIEMQQSLRRWNEELEEKVKQRTRELEEAQKQLIQAEKLATIGTLAGGVAHEINNPLTAVLTNAQMLKMTPHTSEDVECIQLIEEGAKRCQLIVQKLMKYARKPVEEALLSEIDLSRVVESVLAFLRYQLEQENIKVSAVLSSSLDPVRGIGNELEQVVTNIVLNARDAIKSAKKTGMIAVKTYEQNGSVCASIEDDGVGIPEENLSKIFDPFFTTKDVGKGTGLGLAISYGIVEKHGGRIRVESEKAKGTRFTVELPKLQRAGNPV